MQVAIHVYNVNSQIIGYVEPEVQALLRNDLSYVVSGSVFSEYSKQGMWDGTKNLYNLRNQTFPTGLLKRALRALYACGYEVDLIDKRIKPEGKELTLKNVELRDYQIDAVNELADKTRGLLMSCTGSGKTLVTAGLLAKLGVKSLVIVPTTVLLSQTAERLENMLGVEVGMIGDGVHNVSDITVATFQSLTDSADTKKRKFDPETGQWKTVGKKKVIVRENMLEYLSSLDCVISDECFPSGVRVKTEDGYINIAKIVNQKLPVNVYSFNEQTHTFELKPVVHYFKKEVTDDLVKVMFGNHSVLRSTKNHPYYVLRRGIIQKVRADELVVGDFVVSMPRNGTAKDNISNAINETQRQVLLGSILGDGSLRKETDNCRLFISQGEKQLAYLNWKVDLLGNLITGGIREGKSGYCDNKIYIVNTHITQELNEYSCEETEQVKLVLSKLTDLGVAIWYMDDGSICNSTMSIHTEAFTYNTQLLFQKFFKEKYSIEPKIRQYKKHGKLYYYLNFSTSDSKVLSSKISSFIIPSMQYKLLEGYREKFTYKKERELSFGLSKVNNITFEKPKSKYVYNIEVADNHNYLVGNNKLVANCHHLSSASLQRVFEACKNAYYRYGCSATPFSNRDEDVLIEASTGRVLKEITASYLIKEGWLSKPTIHLIPFKQKRGGESTTYAGLYKEKITDNEERNDLLRRIIEYRADKGDSVLVSVRYLEHGHTLYDMLVDKYGSDVVFVNSTVATKKLNETLQKLENKEIKICIGTSLINEGVNLPALNTLVMAGTPKSKISTMQLVGRVLRKTEDKSTVDVYDIQDYNAKYFTSASKERYDIYCSEPEFVLQEDYMFNGDIELLDKNV